MRKVILVGICILILMLNVSLISSDYRATNTNIVNSNYISGNINILNKQSYPELYGNWTVEFNTTGVADLTIFPINETEFGKNLEFLELRCGDRILSPDYDGSRIFYEDYSCDETSYLTNKVLTAGKHGLEFRFGGNIESAYNEVVQYAWIANYASNTVSKIDVSTNSVVATVPVGNSPYGVAVDGNGYVWVANFGYLFNAGDTVSKINSATNSVVATVTVGNLPACVVVDGNGYVWVTAYDGTVSKINSATNSVVATVDVGGWSAGVAVDGNGYVWVASGSIDTVSKINSATNSIVATVAVGDGNWPLGVAVDENGYVWVTMTFGDTVSKIKASTNSVVATVPVGDGPVGVAVDGNGFIWVANAKSDTTSKINPDTNSVVATVAVGTQPSSLGDFTGFAWHTFVAPCDCSPEDACCGDDCKYRLSSHKCRSYGLWSCAGGKCDQRRRENEAYCTGSSANCPSVTYQYDTIDAKKVCSGGNEVDATSSSLACDGNTNYNCAAGSCSGNYRYSECNGAGTCDGAAASYYQQYNVYAATGKTLTNTCGTTGTTLCGYSGYNARDMSNCRRKRDQYRCTATHTCSYNVGNDYDYADNNKVIDSSFNEVSPSTMNYCNYAETCDAGDCSANKYYDACDSSGNCKTNHVGAHIVAVQASGGKVLDNNCAEKSGSSTYSCNKTICTLGTRML